jgi:predicted transcriptional regulator
MNEVAAKPVKHVSAKHVPPHMKSSKLENCLFILQVVAHKGPLKATTIMSEFLIKQRLLKDCLELLVNQNLISKETGYSNKMICDITEGGYNVLSFFKLDVPAKIQGRV